MRTSELLLAQLDRSLQKVAACALPPPPRGGWLKVVRQALGMTTRQLAARLRVTQSAIVQAEQTEASDTISLGQLRRIAAALDCDLRYVLVPRVPLRQRVQAQAERKAREQVAKVAHSMELEAQGTGDAFKQSEIATAKEELLRGRRSRLWD